MFTKPLRYKSLPLWLTLTVVAGAAILCSTSAQARGTKPKPIISTLQSEGDFTTFLKAINDAGLAKTLHGHGPYTVFAPNDAAFAKLPADQRSDLLSDKTKLKRLIDFHVIHTKLTAAELSAQKAGSTPNTLEGDPLRVASAAGVVTVNGAAIVKPDVAASNGTIQEIDTVLMPPSVIALPPGPTPAPHPPAAPANPPPANTPPPASPPTPANPPASPPNTTPAPDNPPATPVSPPMQPANPPGAPANPPGSPGTPLPEQPAPGQPVNPPGAGVPAPSPVGPGLPPAQPLSPPGYASPRANNTPAQ
jgi:uncharacterized surface protein with fasciclin (FAS1) repeats